MGVLGGRRRDQLDQVGIALDVDLGIRPMRQAERPLTVGGGDHAQAMRLVRPEVLVIDEVQQLHLDVVVVAPR